MIVKLEPSQLVFLARAQARLNEALSVASRQEAAVNALIASHPVIRDHMQALAEARIKAQSQQETMQDYMAAIGYPNATLEQHGGELVLNVKE